MQQKFIIFIIILMAAYAGMGCSREKQVGEVSTKPAEKTVTEKTEDGPAKREENIEQQAVPSVSRRLSEVSSNFLSEKEEQRRQSIHESVIEIAKKGAGIAFVEPKDSGFCVFHNGKQGKTYKNINALAISNDGLRVSYIAEVTDKKHVMVLDGREMSECGPGEINMFTPDSTKHISTISNGDKKYIAINGKTNSAYDLKRKPVISRDSQYIAFSVKQSDGKTGLVVSDLQLKNRKKYDSCGDKLFANQDYSVIAATCTKDGMNFIRVIDLIKPRVINDINYEGALTNVSFAPDNSLIYTAMRSDSRVYVAYNGKEETIPEGNDIFSAPMLMSSPERVVAIAGMMHRFSFYEAFQRQSQSVNEYSFIADLAVSRDRRHYAYVAYDVNESKAQVVVDGKEGPKFDVVVSPIFSPDGRYLVYRAREAGNRFIVISDLSAKVLRRHKSYSMVFQPVFSADGRYLEYAVLDGNAFWWKVEKLEGK